MNTSSTFGELFYQCLFKLKPHFAHTSSLSSTCISSCFPSFFNLFTHFLIISDRCADSLCVFSLPCPPRSALKSTCFISTVIATVWREFLIIYPNLTICTKYLIPIIDNNIISSNSKMSSLSSTKVTIKVIVIRMRKMTISTALLFDLKKESSEK